jgi:hypothetical protein
VVALPEDLKAFPLLRGRSLFAPLGTLLDQAIIDHDGIDWWVTDDGVHIELVPPSTAVPNLPKFDQIAGTLVTERWGNTGHKRNTFLSITSLKEISIKLDEAGFVFNEVIQPAQKKALNRHNQKVGRAAVKTFERAASHREFSRVLRKRLYVARDKYQDALKKSEQPSRLIPSMFYSHPPLL